MKGFQEFLRLMIDDVKADRMSLHDDPINLMPEEELIGVITSSFPIYASRVQELIKQKLIIPVDAQGPELFHVSITIDFLNFHDKLELLGYPITMRQRIAAIYYPLFWALCNDIESEVHEYERELGVEGLSADQTTYLRVINEWAVANTIGRVEENIIQLKPEGDKELQELINELALKSEGIKISARDAYEEGEIEKIIRGEWLPPFRYFQQRDIKYLLNRKSLELTEKEKNLHSKGHFDFALCDQRGKLRAAIEYQGSGHYGVDDRGKGKAELRDETKKRICEKAGVPLFILNLEFLYNEDYKRTAKELLRVLRSTIERTSVQFMHDYALNLIRTIIRENGHTTDVDIRHIQRLIKKADTYNIQKRADMLLAVMWETCLAFNKISELSTALA